MLFMAGGMIGRQECRPSLQSGWGRRWSGGFWLLAVAGWELVEEVAIAGDEGGTAAGTGDEALHFGEGFDLFLSHLADFANGSALGDAPVFDELDLSIEERGEVDVRLVSNGIFLLEGASDGGACDGIDERAVEEFCIAGEDADGETERAVRGHDGGDFRSGN